jgi:hypothetical protein
MGSGKSKHKQVPRKQEQEKQEVVPKAAAK